MLKLRPNTISEIQSILDESYFTKDSFLLVNDPIRSSFLVIKFLPISKYVFSVTFRKENYITSEKPGIYLETETAYSREDFSLVVNAIRAWVGRIKEDLDSSQIETEEKDLFFNTLRDGFLSYRNETSHFTHDEISSLNKKLESLENLILGDSNKLNITEPDSTSFKETLISIKDDLNKYQKNIWYTISGNKILKEISSLNKHGSINFEVKFKDKLTELLH